MTIHTKRIYDESAENDGKRILVDRLWPRGIKKENAKIDLWPKEITPSTELRKWYHEDIENRWHEFQQRYKRELKCVQPQLVELKHLAENEQVTLLTAAKNEGHNHVTVLIEVLTNPK